MRTTLSAAIAFVWLASCTEPLPPDTLPQEPSPGTTGGTTGGGSNPSGSMSGALSFTVAWAGAYWTSQNANTGDPDYTRGVVLVSDVVLNCPKLTAPLALQRNLLAFGIVDNNGTMVKTFGAADQGVEVERFSVAADGTATKLAEANGGTLTFTKAGSNGAAGSFDVMWNKGGSLAGHFNAVNCGSGQ